MPSNDKKWHKHKMGAHKKRKQNKNKKRKKR